MKLVKYRKAICTISREIREKVKAGKVKHKSRRPKSDSKQ